MKKQIKITPVRIDGMTLALTAGGDLPKRIRVLKWGENPNAHGVCVRVGEKLKAALANPLHPWRKVALDFEHNTLPGTRAYAESSEPRKVAAFGTLDCIENDGVFLSIEKWTPEGRAMASNYCDVSASPMLDDNGNVEAIHSVALCRNGAVPEMDFVEVALNVDADFFEGGESPQNQNKETNMEKLKAFIAKLLGKDPATVTEDELVEGLQAKIADAPAPATAMSADTISQAVKQVDDKVVALAAEFEALQAERIAERKAAIIADARREGRDVKLPEAAVAALSVEQLSEHIKGLAITIPVTRNTPDYVSEDGNAAGITEQQRTIALNCGMDPEVVFGAAKKAATMIALMLTMGAVMLTAGVALAGPYAAPEKEVQFAQVTAGETIYAGNLVCVWTNSLAYMAGDTANYKVIGRAESTVASGKTLLVKKGIFRYANQGSFADKDIGSDCYVWTNGSYSVTTSAIATNDVKVGTIVDVDNVGVWVNIR